jgi:hypothetical protein
LEAAEGKIQVLLEQGNGAVAVKELEVEDDVEEDEDEE